MSPFRVLTQGLKGGQPGVYAPWLGPVMLSDPDFPNRPDHPDFWRMSDVILQLDGKLENAPTEADREAIFMDVVREHCDPGSLLYMATQRAYRVVGANTLEKVTASLQEIAWLSTVYVESFIAGMEYQKRL